MQEEWRPVVGYEELYEVSNTFKIRSVNRSFSISRLGKLGQTEEYTATRNSVELKPYSISKSGQVKFHLHRRIKHGMGSHTQSDEYVYIDDAVKVAFPELFNCVDQPCKYRCDMFDKDCYCSLNDCEVPDDVDTTGCKYFKLAKTCLDCKYSLYTVFETGTIDDIEYRCPFQDKKLIYDDLNPLCNHYADIPECNCSKFEIIGGSGEN